MLCSRRPAAAIHYAHAPRWQDQVWSPCSSQQCDICSRAAIGSRHAVQVISSGHVANVKCTINKNAMPADRHP